MSRVAISKYQASGNDFLLVDELEGSVGDLDVPALCDRWTGVGADGLIRVGRGATAAFSFALTNADGTFGEMSGNGMRCLAAWLRDRDLVAHGDAIDVETPAGIKHVWLTLDGAAVQMGQPNFTKAAIPMRGPAWETFQEQPFDIGDGRTLAATAVSMGNPHLVLFTEEDPERYHLEHIGPALEHHELFPERTNVEFARLTEHGVDVRVWERGVGETLACGTGACAVAVAAHEAGRTGRQVAVRFRGGTLHVERRSDGEVLLSGPVRHVFDAVVDPDELEG
jgi:diaminopimelate epimerase